MNKREKLFIKYFNEQREKCRKMTNKQLRKKLKDLRNIAFEAKTRLIALETMNSKKGD